MVRIKILAVLLPMFLLQLCSNESNELENNDCENTNLSVFSLEEEYGCINTKYDLSIDLSENFTVIRTQNDFNTMVSGECQPNIDFDTYDLVIGKKGLTNGNDTISYVLIENCETLNLELTVTFNQNATTEAPNLTYHALIPKLIDAQTISVEARIIDTNSLNGFWNLSSIQGGITDVDYSFDVGEITWDFNEATNILTIVNNNVEDVAYDGLETGDYSFSIIQFDAILLLEIGSENFGSFFIENNTLTIDQNGATSGNSDGFILDYDYVTKKSIPI